jgi:stage II sporulation protein AA (anti-sigma F factor antagonist)
MEIKTSKEINATIVTITGRMDAVTAPEFEKTIKQLIDEGNCSFIVDFQGMDYISSAGLRALLATAKLLKGKGGQLLFANIVGTVKEVFDISGFGSIFQTHDSITAALAAIS